MIPQHYQVERYESGFVVRKRFLFFWWITVRVYENSSDFHDCEDVMEHYVDTELKLKDIKIISYE